MTDSSEPVFYAFEKGVSSLHLKASLLELNLANCDFRGDENPGHNSMRFDRRAGCGRTQSVPALFRLSEKV